ncbi:MAG: hypothetical protein PHN56_07295, partial [Candidatus Nanoarchaeia archaeon]|nr:hypothetical protein [Candidatus Nanoarchaeia archaeon]
IEKLIVSKQVNSNLCGNPYCNPQCLEYEGKFFGKRLNVNFIFSNNIVSIECINYKDNIVLDMGEIEFYRTNKDLLK